MLKVFAVFDNAVKRYARPFNMTTTAEALRGWMDVVNDPKTEFYKHPEDYVLFQIAEYDEEHGRYENLHVPEALGSALKYRNDSAPLKAAQ